MDLFKASLCMMTEELYLGSIGRTQLVQSSNISGGFCVKMCLALKVPVLILHCGLTGPQRSNIQSHKRIKCAYPPRILLWVQYMADAGTLSAFSFH